MLLLNRQVVDSFQMDPTMLYVFYYLHPEKVFQIVLEDMLNIFTLHI